MKATLKSSIYFCLPILIILLVAHFFHTLFLSDTLDRYRQIVRNLPKKNVEIIIVGDSHAHDALRNEILPENMYNLSYPGESVKEMYLKAKYALDHSKDIETIIIPLDYHLFTTYRLKMSNKAHSLSYSDYKDYNFIYGDDVSAFEHWAKKQFPLLSMQERSELLKKTTLWLKGSLQTKNKTSEISWLELSENEKYKKIRKRANWQFIGNFEEPTLMQSYESLIELAQNAGKRVVLLTYPLTDEYISHLQANFELPHLDSIANRYPNATHLNYSALFKDHPNLFANEDHLNLEGSKAFVPLLLNTIDIQILD